jgi:hypothetical protein
MPAEWPARECVLCQQGGLFADADPNGTEQVPARQMFAAPKVSSVRKSDPRPAKQAAAKDEDYRATQATRLLRAMYDRGSITADAAYRDLAYEDEDVDRGEWSTRLGVLCAGVYPLAEKAGEVPDFNKKGKVRNVTSYRLTKWGRAEVELMLGRAS